MITKTVEIRDAATFFPALAIKLYPDTERERYLVARAGYGLTPRAQGQYVLLMRLADGKTEATYDPHAWPNRTMRVAHSYLVQHFDDIESGAVVDVEFILGETAVPKRPEAEAYGGI